MAIGLGDEDEERTKGESAISPAKALRDAARAQKIEEVARDKLSAYTKARTTPTATALASAPATTTAPATVTTTTAAPATTYKSH